MARRKVMVKKIYPFSAFRTALLLSLSALVAWLLAVVLLYFGLNILGTWEKLNAMIGGAGGSSVVTFELVISIAALFGALLAIVATLLAPVLALLYNAISNLFGGVEVTLVDKLG